MNHTSSQVREILASVSPEEVWFELEYINTHGQWNDNKPTWLISLRDYFRSFHLAANHVVQILYTWLAETLMLERQAYESSKKDFLKISK